MRTLIQNCMLFDPHQNICGDKYDILLYNGKVEKIDSKIDCECENIYNADGMYVFPGFIDVHTHFRDPGQEEKETLETGSKAALHGGYTTCFVMPNTEPAIDNEELLAYVKLKSHWIDVLPISAATKERKGEEIVDFRQNLKDGAITFSDDGDHIKNPYIMKKVLEESEKNDFVFIQHSLDNNFFKDGCINYGKYSKQLGLKGLPEVGETSVIYRDIEMIKQFGGNIHFAHVSTPEGIRLITEAKQNGYSVSSEIAPHHLLFSDDELATKNAIFKVMPPLRSKKTVNEMIKLLVNNQIDIIATDHAPHTQKEKNMDITMAPPGMTGLETAFISMYTELIDKGLVDINQIIRMMTINPAKRFGLKDVGTLIKGFRANLTIFNPNCSQKITNNFFQSKSLNSPCMHKEYKGRIEKVFVDGHLVYNKGAISRVS